MIRVDKIWLAVEPMDMRAGPDTALARVIYDFTPSRAGAHARTFLADWQGKLVTDDYSGYKQSFKQGGITEIACMAHACRKFYELHVANQSEIEIGRASCREVGV